MTETTPINSVGVELNPHALEAALVAHLDGVGCTPWKNDAWDRCDANGTPKRVAIQESVERAISAYLSAAPTPPVGQVFSAQPNDLDARAAALAAHALHDDHLRGCQGREYDCTCGYDAKTGLLASALQADATPGSEQKPSTRIEAEELARIIYAAMERAEDDDDGWPTFESNLAMVARVGGGNIYFNEAQKAAAEILSRLPIPTGSGARADAAAQGREEGKQLVIEQLERSGAALQSDLDAARAEIRRLRTMAGLDDDADLAAIAGEPIDVLTAAVANRRKFVRPVTEGEG